MENTAKHLPEMLAEVHTLVEQVQAEITLITECPTVEAILGIITVTATMIVAVTATLIAFSKTIIGGVVVALMGSYMEIKALDLWVKACS
jgi:hypothetical protein